MGWRGLLNPPPASQPTSQPGDQFEGENSSLQASCGPQWVPRGTDAHQVSRRHGRWPGRGRVDNGRGRLGLTIDWSAVEELLDTTIDLL